MTLYKEFTYDTEHGGVRRRYALVLPASVGHERQRQEMERQGVAATTREGVFAQNQRTPAIQGTVAVLHRDEREAKYGRPLVMADIKPGQTPIMVVGGGAMHWQEMQETLAEKRHYRDDVIERPPEDRPNMQELWVEYVKARLDAQVGRKRYYTAGLQQPSKR